MTCEVIIKVENISFVFHFIFKLLL